MIFQSYSSKAMMMMGGTEVLSRLVTSLLGDYIKGYLLHMYIFCCLMLAVINILGYFASTYVQLSIYGIGMSSRLVYNSPIRYRSHFLLSIKEMCSDIL